MMLQLIFVALGIGCSSAAQQKTEDPPAYEYGGLRDPAFPVEKADPVVPPPAAPAEAPSPKAEPAGETECERLNRLCDEMRAAQGHTRGEACTRHRETCVRAKGAS